MSSPPSRSNNTLAPVLLGAASFVLITGSIVGTCTLWELIPGGARVALVMLDVSLELFLLAGFVCILQGSDERSDSSSGAFLQEQRAAEQRPSEQRLSEQRPLEQRPLRKKKKRRPRPVQLDVVRELANRLDATLVRRRDGSYSLKVGPVSGKNRIGIRSLLPGAHADLSDESTESWLTTVADSLDAELVYDGKGMEWYLNWPKVQEVEDDDDGDRFV